MSNINGEMAGSRKKKAFETLKEAKALAAVKSWNGVPNRLYYSAFYMVSALLVKNGFVAKTHSGNKTLFFKEFIKTNKISADKGKFFQQLFDLLTESEYKGPVPYDEAGVQQLITETESFLHEIKTVLISKK